MFSGDIDIIQQINSAIRKNWCKECTEILGHLAAPDNIASIENTNDKNEILQNVNSVTFRRMKERIEALEELNDHLYYYICFLVENLPELILKTIQSDLDNNHLLKYNGLPQINGNEKFKIEDKGVLPFPTRREKDVLELLEKGYCAKEIATRLFISETTVITHKKNLKKKFNVKNTVELISKLRNNK